MEKNFLKFIIQYLHYHNWLLGELSNLFTAAVTENNQH